MDDEDEVIGVVRTIFGPYDELPVGQFERTDHTHPDPVCELSSLTVRTDVRSTGVIEHLYRAGWLDAFRAGSTTLVALIDDWLLDVFKGTYRLPFDIIGVGQEYMGSTPVPVAMPLAGPRVPAHGGREPGVLGLDPRGGRARRGRSAGGSRLLDGARRGRTLEACS